MKNMQIMSHSILLSSNNPMKQPFLIESSTAKAIFTVVLLTLIPFLGGVSQQISAQNAVVNFTVNPTKASINVYDEADNMVHESTLVDSVGTVSLAPGSYRLVVSKRGHETFTELLLLNPNEVRNLQIDLEKSPRGFFSKNKYWIIGGAVAVTTGAILLLRKDSDNGPGIPVPPGRPN